MAQTKEIELKNKKLAISLTKQQIIERMQRNANNVAIKKTMQIV